MARQRRTPVAHDRPGFVAVLREAVHGGPSPAPADLTAWRHAAGLPAPFRVVALQYGDGPAPALPPRSAQVDLLLVHPGLAYLCCAELRPWSRLLANRRWLVGESRVADDEGQLVPTIQNALLALRQRELAAVRRRRGESPDFAAETAARAMALQRLRQGADWRPALTVWVEIVLCRHSGHLRTIQRKLVEFVTLATCAVDRGVDLASEVRAGVDRLYATFALTQLASAVQEVVAALAPRLAATTTAVPPLVRRAQAVLHDRFAEPLSLRVVARSLGVSPAHLSRRFSAATGQTLTHQLNALRLAHARDLLAHGDEGILPIALAAGFASLEHFHRLFRRETGTTPARWRAAQRS